MFEPLKTFGQSRRVHFVGIGGIGMSGIAELLINLGFMVSGSDVQLSPVTKRLEQLGARIHKGHRGDHVTGADVVVYSSAVKMDNPEIQKALALKIPVIRRAEMLGELMRLKLGIGVAGTHGKTTTSSMVGLVLQEGGLDPTLIVGGKLKALGTNTKLGAGPYLVVEADEFDRSFLQLTPTMVVVTNIETEHLDCYEDLEEIKSTFVQFINKVPFYGSVILCLDEMALQEIMPRVERRIITYGLNPQSDIRALDAVFREQYTEFTVISKSRNLGRIKIQLPGIHNVKNSLAAIAVGLELQIDFTNIRKALEKFAGVHRRFEIKGDVKGVLVVDDYAHHPTEIKASLRAAQEGWGRRVIAVFQPHLYTRTRDFYQEFGQSFFNADILVVTDIYPAREEPIPGITGELVAEAARSVGHRHVLYIPDKEDVVDRLSELISENDLVITLGAGDIYKTGEALIKKMGS